MRPRKRSEGAPGVSALIHDVQSRFPPERWPRVPSAQLTAPAPLSGTVSASTRGGDDGEEHKGAFKNINGQLCVPVSSVTLYKRLRCSRRGFTSAAALCTSHVTICLQYFIMIFAFATDTFPGLFFFSFCSFIIFEILPVSGHVGVPPTCVPSHRKSAILNWLLTI